VLQSDSLKLESCKFNIIINIINITLGQALQLDPRLLGISLQKDLTLLDLSLFYIFYARKKKLTRVDAFVFFPFLFLF
jgi:hypothetical protein